MFCRARCICGRQTNVFACVWDRSPVFTNCVCRVSRVFASSSSFVVTRCAYRHVSHTLHVCVFQANHTLTGLHILKGLKLLTNSPWLMGLGRLCDGRHQHTALAGRHVAASSHVLQHVSQGPHLPGEISKGVNAMPVIWSAKPTQQ